MAEYELNDSSGCGPYFYIYSLLNDLVLTISDDSAKLEMWELNELAPSVKQLWYEDKDGYLRSKYQQRAIEISKLWSCPIFITINI